MSLEYRIRLVYPLTATSMSARPKLAVVVPRSSGRNTGYAGANTVYAAWTQPVFDLTEPVWQPRFDDLETIVRSQLEWERRLLREPALQT